MNIEAARVALADLNEQREQLEGKLNEIRSAAEEDGKRDLTDDETRTCDEGFAELDKLDAEAERMASEIEKEEKRDSRLKPVLTQRAASGVATARGSLKVESVYRPDNSNDHYYFRDLVQASTGNWQAAERMNTHQNHTLASLDDGQRAANTTSSTAGGGFIPPVFLGSDYAEYAREARPFVDILPTRPLMQFGMTLTIPRITTGTTVDDQGATENTAVSTTAIVDSPLSVPVRTIAGYNDVSQQLLDRSEPGIDQIIFNDLRSAYDGKVDTFCLSGTGTNQHTGIRAVSSINTVQYTDGSPTAAELTPKLYDAIQKIASNRFKHPNYIVMHPRRAAWLASNLSSTFPLFQQGGFLQAAGAQNEGFVMSIGGLPVVLDANIATNYSDGGNTNEDEIYVVYSNDLLFFEGPVQARVDPYTVGLNLTVRLVLFAYSAFASGRFAKSITKIYGSGLATPSF